MGTLGILAGFCTLAGAAILIYRRRTVGPVFSATTVNDKVMYVLLVGAIVIENVFVLPGLGRLLFQSVGNRDLIVVEDLVMLLTAVVLLVNFLVDLSYRALDPRIRTRR